MYLRRSHLPRLRQGLLPEYHAQHLSLLSNYAFGVGFTVVKALTVKESVVSFNATARKPTETMNLRGE